MVKYLDIEPITIEFYDSFKKACERTKMTEEEVAKEIGFESNSDRLGQLIFEDISIPAYARRLNIFLSNHGIPLRFSQEAPKRRHHGIFDKKR